MHGKPFVSPLSTGGAGITYEHGVQASFLLHGLLGNDCPYMKVGDRIAWIRFQNRNNNEKTIDDGRFMTDDLLVACESGSRLLLSIKQTCQLAGGSSTLKEVLSNAAKDFADAGFNNRLDAIALIIPYFFGKNSPGLFQLTARANDYSTFEEFNSANPSGGMHDAFMIIKEILGEGFDDERTLSFLKCFRLAPVSYRNDTTCLGGTDMVALARLVRICTSGQYPPHQVWSELLRIVSYYDGSGTTIYFDGSHPYPSEFKRFVYCIGLDEAAKPQPESSRNNAVEPPNELLPLAFYGGMDSEYVADLNLLNGAEEDE